MTQIELEVAYYWNCPGCKADNFGRMQRVPQDVLDEMGSDEQLLECPKTVLCEECLGHFDVVDKFGVEYDGDHQDF